MRTNSTKFSIKCCLMLLMTVIILQLSVPAVYASKVAYVPIRPIFVTNLQDSTRKFLSVEVSLMVAADGSVEQAVRNNMPLIKDVLVELFSEQTLKDLRKPDGRRALEKKALDNIMRALNQYVGNVKVKKVLFTKFTVG